MAETHTAQQDTVTVHWQDAAPAGGALGGLPFIFMMIGVFYFVLIRPQQKERKQHEAFVAALQKGQRIVTRSGLHGRIDAVAEKTVDVEIADKVRVTVDKMSVARSGES
jgi:preprotein translocase subunit YajC